MIRVHAHEYVAVNYQNSVFQTMFAYAERKVRTTGLEANTVLIVQEIRISYGLERIWTFKIILTLESCWIFKLSCSKLNRLKSFYHREARDSRDKNLDVSPLTIIFSLSAGRSEQLRPGYKFEPNTRIEIFSVLISISNTQLWGTRTTCDIESIPKIPDPFGCCNALNYSKYMKHPRLAEVQTYSCI